MWIISKELSAYVPDMVGSSSDSPALALMCEQSLMWRSKRSSSGIWLRRLKKRKWMLHLSGMMLNPSHSESFVERYTASLEDIRASHSAQQGSDREKQTTGIYGLTLQMEFPPVTRTGYFLRMLKDISTVGSYQSSPIWKKWVTTLRSAYSQRLKLAHHTRESECLSWPAATARDWKNVGHKASAKMRAQKGHGQPLPVAVINGLPDQDSDNTTGNHPECVNWLTPQARDFRSGEGERFNNPERTKNLNDQIGKEEKQNWLTPKQPSGGGQSERKTKGGGLRKLEDQIEGSGKMLNPRWVECLMGLPSNWVKPDKESSNRCDELRMLGNGIVPQTAAKAWIILMEKLEFLKEKEEYNKSEEDHD